MFREKWKSLLFFSRSVPEASVCVYIRYARADIVPIWPCFRRGVKNRKPCAAQQQTQHTWSLQGQQPSHLPQHPPAQVPQHHQQLSKPTKRTHRPALTTRVLTFAEQNMAPGTTTSPIPVTAAERPAGFGDAAPGTPSLRFDFSWLASFFEGGKILTWEVQISATHMAQLSLHLLSCVIVTLYALIWLVISHVGWHVIDAGPGLRQLQEWTWF